MGSFRQLVFILFLVYFTVAVLFGFAPLELKTHPLLLKSLLSGSDQGFIIPGANDLMSFKPYLSKNGFYSFIMDFPYDEHDEHADFREFFWLAENYLVPIVLNRNPGETEAIVFCANDSVAEKRLNETGYEWTHKLGNGKGMAKRKP